MHPFQIYHSDKGVFSEILSTLPPFVGFLDKKKQKDCLPGEKNFKFCQNYRSGTGRAFPDIMSKMLPFVPFLDKNS